jgi:hypothetical protein
MPKVSKVEADIFKSEGFQITLKYPDGRDVRSDKATNVKAYAKPQKMAKNSFSVKEWKDKRFKKQYPQFRADVLKADGKKAGGNTKLSTIRDTYLSED